MKPKKTTAPSNSQRDSQDLKEEYKSKCLVEVADSEGSHYQLDYDKTFNFLQQEIDKSYQAGKKQGFQEAVEQILREILNRKESYINEDRSGNNLTFLDHHISWLTAFLKSLKPTLDQGSEGEEFYDNSNSEQLKKENREDLVKMEILVNRKKGSEGEEK